MVQVDIFWSYAIGSGLAISASRQLLEHAKSESSNLTKCSHFTHTLLFLALVFVPSGTCLLWAFPSWETMHVGDRTLPAWLVTAFSITNVTQGLLGFLVVYQLLQKGYRYLAFLQLPIAYFLFFFVLVHGWDGTGYERFFSATRADFLAFDPFMIPMWFVSDVAITLYLFSIVFLPWLFYLMASWLDGGYKLGDVDTKRAMRAGIFPIIGDFAKLIFGHGLLSAIVSSIMIHWFGWLIGIALTVILGYILLLRKGGLTYKLADRLLLPEGKL